MISTSKIYCQNPDFVGREVADEFLLIPVRQHLSSSNSLYVLNPTGAAFWRLLDGKQPLIEIIRNLSSEFDVTEDQLTQDVSVILEDLLSIEAVEESGS